MVVTSRVPVFNEVPPIIKVEFNPWVSVPITSSVVLTVRDTSLLTVVPEPTVTLLKTGAVAVMVHTPAPKITVPVPGAKTDPVPFHAFELAEFAFRVLRFPFSVPANKDTSPVKVWISALPPSRLRIPPPTPFIVRALALTAPPKVAAPPDFVIETFPVVMKPAIA